MNQAGLCLAWHEVFTPAVETTYNPNGVPFAICLRAVLESCRTVADTVRVIEATPHVTVNNVVLCDAGGGVMVEIAPEGVKSRPITAEVRACTNHFSHPDWRNPQQANADHIQDRLARLGAAPAVGVGVEEVRQALDGVLEQRANYERSGFRFAHQHVRHQGIGGGVTPAGVMPLSTVPFAEVAAYDRTCFPAARPEFLRRWTTLQDSAALAVVDEGQLRGYGVIRRSVDGYKIGPLFAEDVQAAERLLQALWATAPGVTLMHRHPGRDSQRFGGGIGRVGGGGRVGHLANPRRRPPRPDTTFEGKEVWRLTGVGPLQRCYPADPSKGRPAGFMTAQGDGLILVTYTRFKRPDGKGK